MFRLELIHTRPIAYITFKGIVGPLSLRLRTPLWLSGLIKALKVCSSLLDKKLNSRQLTLVR